MSGFSGKSVMVWTFLKVFTLVFCICFPFLFFDVFSADAMQQGHTAAPKAAISFGRGINILTHSYDKVWVDRKSALFKANTFAAVRKAGFRTVRVPLIAFQHMDDSNRLNPKYLNNLDWVIDQASAQGLNVILDFHEFRRCGADPDTCEVKMSAFWEQVAARYQSRPSSVIFEILNEPMEKITPKLWNRLLRKELTIIRRTNPYRIVLVCTAMGGRINGLQNLDLPENDKWLVVDVHYYDPYPFTHQGVPDNLKLKQLRNVPWGSAAEKAKLDADFEFVAKWGVSHSRPMFLGEFGTYEKAPATYRPLWTAAVARAAQARNIPWAYFELSDEYGIYNLKTNTWNEIILRSLMR